MIFHNSNNYSFPSTFFELVVPLFPEFSPWSEKSITLCRAKRKGVCWLSLRNDARAKTSCSKEWRSVFFDEGGRKRGEGEKRSGRRAWPSGIPGFAKSARRGWFSVSTGRITGACLSLPDKPAAKRRRWLNRSRGCDLSSPLDQPDVWKRERERERDAGSCADNPFSSPSFFPTIYPRHRGKNSELLRHVESIVGYRIIDTKGWDFSSWFGGLSWNWSRKICGKREKVFRRNVRVTRDEDSLWHGLST